MRPNQPQRVILVKTRIRHPIKNADFGVPLGLWTLKSFLEQKRIECTVFDERLELVRRRRRHEEANGLLRDDNLVPLEARWRSEIRAELESRLKESDVAGFSVCSCEVPEALERAKVAKGHGCTTVFGGIFTDSNEDFLLSSGVVDYVVPGVAHEPFFRLLRALDRGSSTEPIHGVWASSSDSVRHDGTRKKYQRFSTIPSIGPSQISEIHSEYGPHLGHKIDLVSQRGCTMSCTFCSIARETHTVISRTKSEVINDVLALAELGYETISVKDENFALSSKDFRIRMLEDIAKELRSRKLKVGFKIKARLDFFRREPSVIAVLAACGVREVQIGLEVLSPEQQAKVRKGYKIATAEMNQILAALVDAGIRVNASFILGSPGETTRDHASLVEWVGAIRDLDMYKVYVNFFTPHPWKASWPLSDGFLAIPRLECYTHKLPVYVPASLMAVPDGRESLINTYHRVGRISRSMTWNPEVPPEICNEFLGAPEDRNFRLRPMELSLVCPDLRLGQAT